VKEPKLVFVKFKDHAQHFSIREAGTLPEDVEKMPIPIATISLCGWILKESEEAVWLYAMRTEYPEEITNMYDLRSEGYHAYWCILKQNIMEMKEVMFKEKEK